MDEKVLEFRLCKSCRERQGAGELPVALAEDDEGCFICKGISGSLGGVTEKIVCSLGRFEFQTFSVGLILPRGVQEREDMLRSELKIRGGETIKSEFAGRLARAVAKGMRGKKRIDRLNPDATVLVDVEEGSVAVTSKPLFLFARYTKPRGVSQRRLFCEGCSGRGCERCQGSGYSASPSVEGLLSKKFGALLGSKKFKFTWFGSEDPDSEVLSPGRPMVIESKNPLRRHAPRALRLSTGEGWMSVSGIHVVGKNFERPTFVFRTRVVIRAERPVSSEEVKRLQRGMRKAVVQYRNNKGRLVDKKIYFVRADARGRRITAEVKLDGGLPVKRLVSGEAVSPSFSGSIGIPLRCERFDILRVWPQKSAKGG